MDNEGRRDSWTGRIVSHYRLLDELGRGGMGVVYKAQDLLLERLVALKFLRVGREGEVARQRLLQEARAASSLDHPNICTIYEADQDGEGNLFMAMRLCEGETLKDKIARGPVDLDLTSQIAAGLAHAHEQPSSTGTSSLPTSSSPSPDRSRSSILGSLFSPRPPVSPAREPSSARWTTWPLSNLSGTIILTGAERALSGSLAFGKFAVVPIDGVNGLG
jgi:protein kinase-like protein